MISTNNKGTTNDCLIVYPNKLQTNKRVKPADIVKGIPTFAFGNSLRAIQGAHPPTIRNSKTKFKVMLDTDILPMFVSITKLRVVI